MLTTATTIFYNHDQVLKAQAQEEERKNLGMPKCSQPFKTTVQVLKYLAPTGEKLIQVCHMLPTFPLGQRVAQ